MDANMLKNNYAFPIEKEIIVFSATTYTLLSFFSTVFQGEPLRNVLTDIVVNILAKNFMSFSQKCYKIYVIYVSFI